MSRPTKRHSSVSHAMTKTIIIKESGYYCYQDEKHFFEWLESIPGIENVIGVPAGLSFTVPAGGLERDSWGDLIGLLFRYGIALTALRELAASEPTGWLKDPKWYWHDALFGTDA